MSTVGCASLDYEGREGGQANVKSVAWSVLEDVRESMASEENPKLQKSEGTREGILFTKHAISRAASTSTAQTIARPT